MLMKLVILPTVLFLISLLSANLSGAVQTTQERNLADPFNFRYNILRRFNYARRVLASGDLEVFFSTLKLAGLDELPQVGPASDMYRLEWSRDMETAAYLATEKQSQQGKLPKKQKNPDNNSGSINEEGLIGFYWLGDIVEMILEAIKAFLPGSVDEFLQKWMGVIELILLCIWLGWKFPQTPYSESRHGTFGATEILMADRYQVGCYSRILYSMCYLRPVEYRGGMMFQVGASCVDCPPGSQCEYFREPDGTYKEGNLCIINETLTNQLKEEARLRELALNATTTESLGMHADYLLPMTLVLVLLLIIQRR